MVHEIGEIGAVECYLVIGIGRPITDPHIVELKIQLRRGGAPDHFPGEVRPILERELVLQPAYWREVSAEAETP
jgi:S-adenosylmethionine synthetase